MSSVANTISTRSALRRGLFAGLTTLFLAAAITGAIVLGTGWWQLVRIRSRPRCRPARRRRAPASRRASCIRAPSRSTTLCTATGGPRCSRSRLSCLPTGYLVGALAWAFHISLDRTVGYGKRTRDGFQRCLSD